MHLTEPGRRAKKDDGLLTAAAASAAFDDVVTRRRSTRAFADRRVPDDVVLSILDAARHAPSSMDGQPWAFIVVRNLDALRRIAEIKNRHSDPAKRDYPADFVASAPLLVAVCVDRSRSHDRERENGVIAATILLLAAHARGLGGTYLTAYQPHDDGLARELAGLLRLPADVEPVALVPLGYPASRPPAKNLRPLSELVHYEFLGGN